ncbi:MAG: hypothetical protein HZA92_05280 [Verrucomicrobia bacterium]|nr:hypothetical protein [Verrucomicrobiota bacterium]
MRPTSRFILAGALLLGTTLLTRAAVTVGSTNVQIGGFFSQGYLKSSKNNHPFEAKDGTWDFREMAVNVSTTIGTHLRVGAQGFAQKLGNYGRDEVLLDWANADYNFRPEFGVRAGRIKYPKGLYGEALDVDAIRPFIFLPNNIYSVVRRDFSASFDGAMFYGSLNAKQAGSFDYKLFYGDIAMSPKQGVADLFNNANLFAAPGVQSLSVEKVYGVAIDWSTPLSGLKIHASYSKLDQAVATGRFLAVPALPLRAEVSPAYTTVGAEYTRGDWTLAAEYMHEDGPVAYQTQPASVFSVARQYGTRNYYASVARRFGEKWELGAYYAKAKNAHPAATDPEPARHLDDWAFAIRYNVNEHVIVKAEFHTIDGRYNVINTPRTPNPTLADSMSFWALKTTFVF